MVFSYGSRKTEKSVEYLLPSRNSDVPRVDGPDRRTSRS